MSRSLPIKSLAAAAAGTLVDAAAEMAKVAPTLSSAAQGAAATGVGAAAVAWAPPLAALGAAYATSYAAGAAFERHKEKQALRELIISEPLLIAQGRGIQAGLRHVLRYRTEGWTRKQKRRLSKLAETAPHWWPRFVNGVDWEGLDQAHPEHWPDFTAGDTPKPPFSKEEWYTILTEAENDLGGPVLDEAQREALGLELETYFAEDTLKAVGLDPPAFAQLALSYFRKLYDGQQGLADQLTALEQSLPDQVAEKVVGLLRPMFKGYPLVPAQRESPEEQDSDAARLERVRQYHQALERETAELLLDRFRPGGDVDEDQALLPLLDEVYVELDLKGAGPVRSDDASTEVWLRALDQGLGAASRTRSFVWMSAPGRGLLGEVTVADWQVVKLPFGLGEDPNEDLITAYADGACGSDKWTPIQDAHKGGTLLLAIQVEDPRVALDGRWEAECAGLRDVFPKARILGCFPQTGLPLEVLLELDPDLHQLPGRYVVRGHPGTGKSTCLRAVARRVAAGGWSDRLPVLVDLARLAEESSSDPRERFSALESLAGIADQLEGVGDNLLFLLDGLDEVPNVRRDGLLKCLEALEDTWPAAQVVVTTRRVGYRPFAPRRFQELDLLPLDETRQRRLLQQWFDRDERVLDSTGLADRVLLQIGNSPQGFQTMCEVPLLLTFVAMLYADHADDGDFGPSTELAAFYAEVLTHLLEGRHRRRSVGDRSSRAVEPLAGAREVLQSLALHATEQEAAGGRELTQDQWLTHLRMGASEGRLPSGVTLRWPDDLQGFLQHIAERSGILGGPPSPSAPWPFWHRTLREALVAERLASQYRSGSKEAIHRRAADLKGREGLWAEPYALFVGGLEAGSERDSWLVELSQANAELALRVLGSVERVGSEAQVSVLAAAMDSGTGDEERRTAYAEVFERLGQDVEATASVLGRLAESSDDCEDLWHMERALHALLLHDAAAEELVRKAEDRFFSHRSFGDPLDPASLNEHGVNGRYWAEIPSGSFSMGGSAHNLEQPIHDVNFEAGFQLASVPVTEGLWQRFRPQARASDEQRLPKTEVTWFEAAMFCKWLGARLPSEAEWEYACRAGSETEYGFGDNSKELSGHAWFTENSDGHAWPVGQKPPNRWGLHDMHGNVWEWCQDEWHEDYEGAPDDGSAREDTGAGDRAIRGGSWHDPASGCRSAFRPGWPPGGRHDDLGFRPARST